jgi:tetratricopeptide (TPR) repeat protein
MAKKTKEKDENLVNVGEVYSKTEQYVDENRNTLLVIAGILVVLFAGYFAVTRLYLEPKNQEGMDLIWKAEYWFEIDSLDKALVGNESYYGFEYVADEYSTTDAGELAAYYCGIIYLKKQDFPMAVEYLKDVDLDDEVAGAVAKGALGDAYLELGNYSEALSQYEKAVSHSDNSLTAPVYLKKAGLLLEDQGKFEAALEKYQEIKEKYPKSTEGRGIESYIARVGG